MKEIIQTVLTTAIFATVTVVSAKCPDKPRGETRKYQGYCLEFIKSVEYYKKAQDICRMNNGHLVTIENKEKQTWLAKTIEDELRWVDKSMLYSNTNIWIGITRDQMTQKIDSSGRLYDQFWYADNGKYDAQSDMIPLKYENWDRDEPESVVDRNCAKFGYYTDFKWQAVACEQFPHSYLVICQYDGPDGLLSSPAFSVPVLGITSVATIACAVLIYKCYIKRRDLERQLRNERSDDNIYCPEYHIKNTDNNVDDDHTKFSTDNNNTPSPYAPVTNISTATATSNSYHDFNMLSDPGYLHDKTQRKDLRNFSPQLATNFNFDPPTYHHSVSAPAGFPPICPTAPSETCSVVMEEDDNEHHADENAPLHFQRTDSIESNSLCA